jgi:single-stranded-DNA-specific exonuclease
VGEKHLSLKLRLHGKEVDGIWFCRTDSLPAKAVLAYRLDNNTWQGRDKLQLQIENMQAALNRPGVHPQRRSSLPFRHL